jgi:hypothetical protein
MQFARLDLRTSLRPARPSPRFKTRPHKLGIDLDECEPTAIGGGELIVARTIRIAEGARAIRIDAIRAGEGLVTSNLPVKLPERLPL